MGHLDALRELDLSRNALGGALPAAFADFDSLARLFLQDNPLADLIDLSALGKLAEVDVRMNRLTFEDLEPNVGHRFAISYAPQHSVDAERNVTGFQGEAVRLHVPVAGAYNQYQWYKDGVAIAGADRDTLVIPRMALADSGTYQLFITSSQVSGLVLMSVPIEVRFEQRFDGSCGPQPGTHIGCGSLFPCESGNDQVTRL